MSQTYNFACTQCRKTLWVGQRSILYDQPETAEFLHKHRGHPLLFDISETFDDDYEDITEYNRSNQEVKIEYQAICSIGIGLSNSWSAISEEDFMLRPNRYLHPRKIQILEEKQ